MLVEAGGHLAMNTLLAGAIKEGQRFKGVIAESRAGREAILARLSWTAPPMAIWPLSPARIIRSRTIIAW